MRLHHCNSVIHNGVTVVEVGPGIGFSSFEATLQSQMICNASLKSRAWSESSANTGHAVKMSRAEHLSLSDHFRVILPHSEKQMRSLERKMNFFFEENLCP